ncbi:MULTISPECIES: pilus assembly protein [unclassified Pseudomonas]|uniref:pilus assembly protein n=1 Tax=unclassified Pseudomonas TaxID=196821 RepID=UPI00384EAF09
MRALDLEFQPQRRGSRPGWALLGLGLVLGVSVAATAHVIGEDIHEQQGQLGHAQRKLQVHTAPTTGLTPAQQREQEIRLSEMKQISAQLRRPWERLFATLETLRGNDIALLSLSPDARKGQIRISAEARDLDAMLAFHRQLQGSPELRDVSLVNHEIVANAPQKPILFNLLATWEVSDVRP